MPTKLEIAAINARQSLLVNNIYQEGIQAGTEYSATHTRAISDQITPEYGKGTGNFLDINNYNAGSKWDIYGRTLGTGRKQAFILNKGIFGYDPNYTYDKHAPDMLKNKGQVII